MRTFLKILKKYTFPILLVFVLLFIQAYCDLSLPDYTSKIVNIGIQQSGISHVTPTVMSETFYNRILLFVNNDEKAIIEKSYTLANDENKEFIESNSNEKDIYNLSTKINENVYVLTGSNIEELDELLVYPIILSSTFEKVDLGMKSDFDNYTVLGMMPEENRISLISTMKEKYQEAGSSLVEQGAINFVKLEYEKVGMDVNKIQIDYIIEIGLKMLALALIAMFIAIVSTYISSKIAAFISRDLRSKVVNKVMTYSNKEFEELGTSSLITRSTNDIQQIQLLFIMLLRFVFYAPVVGIGAYTKVSGSDMGWVIGLAVSIIISMVIILFVVALPKFQKVQKMIDKLNLVAREILSGLPVIRAFSNEKREEKRFDDANKNLMKVNLFVNRVMAIMMPTMLFIMNGVCVLIVWVGASKIDAGTMQVGTLMAFISYAIQIIISFLMISMVSIMVPRAIISLKRICQVFDKDTSIKEIEQPKKFDVSKKGIVEFKDVYFRYPDALEDVLQNINFKAMPGTTTAFIGSTGSGKSTLINLIPRFFDVTGGKILIDGVNIKEVKLEELRSKIGFVPQKGMLFSGTIKSNIGFGTTSLSKEHLEKSARISQSLEFINEKEDKYNASISQGGTNVSGGQRQRLAIARAIAINPDIYIFDDSFSALDYKTDAKLRASLAKETKDSTIFIVAQRISTVIKADQIIVLNNGEIVGIGTHKELLKNCDVYKEIAYSQLSKEELENE